MLHKKKLTFWGCCLFFLVSATVHATTPPVRGIIHGMVLFCWKEGKVIQANQCPEKIQEVGIVSARSGPIKVALWETVLSEVPAKEEQLKPCGNTRGAMSRKGPTVHDLQRKMQQLKIDEKRFLALIGEQIKLTNPSITKLFRVDLDGDSVKEVLFEVNSHNEFIISGPDTVFSIIGVRKLQGTKVKVFVLHDERRVVEEGKQLSYWLRGSLVGVTDIEGDGKLEVVYSTEYFEGGSTTVVSLDGTKKKVLGTNGCGS